MFIFVPSLMTRKIFSMRVFSKGFAKVFRWWRSIDTLQKFAARFL